jgi:hypothetical protein
MANFFDESMNTASTLERKITGYVTDAWGRLNILVLLEDLMSNWRNRPVLSSLQDSGTTHI